MRSRRPNCWRWACGESSSYHRTSSRLHSRAGEITGFLYEVLTAAGVEVAVLPALGTHARVDRR